MSVDRKAEETLNVAILNLGNNLGFILQGILLTLGVLYYSRYGSKDSIVFKLAVGVSLLLETIGTGFNLSYGWKTVDQDGISRLHWEPQYSIIVSLPAMVISQAYFFYRAWTLSGRPWWAICFWSSIAAVELLSGEASFLVTVYKRTLEEPKPPESVDLLTSHLTLVAVIDLAVSACFILKIRSMKSSLERSDNVVQQILLLTIISNLIFFSLAMMTLLFKILLLGPKWYRIPMEAAYRSYSIAFLVALLTRDSMREQLDGPIPSIQFPMDLNDHTSERTLGPENRHLSKVEEGSPLSPSSPSPPLTSLARPRSRTLPVPTVYFQSQELSKEADDHEKAKDETSSFKSCPEPVAPPCPSLKSPLS